MSMPPYDPAMYGAPTPPKESPRNKLIFAFVILGVGLMLCLFGSCVAAISGSDKEVAGRMVAPTQTFSALPAEQPATTPAPPSTAPAARTLAATSSKAETQSFGDGSWEVGSDIKAGTYTTTATDHCYWERLRDFDGEFSSIIANDNLFSGERGRIRIKSTDEGVQFSGGCIWEKK